MIRGLLLGAALLTIGGCGCHEPALLILTTKGDRPEITIPDGGTVERVLNLEANGNILRATAEVIVQHPRPEDLTVTITSPEGTDVELGGRLAENCDYYRYAVPLLALQDEPATGRWRLTVRDDIAGEEGLLVTWGIGFEALDGP